MTFIADFYDEISEIQVAEREGIHYLKIAAASSSFSDDPPTIYVRNQQTGALLACTPTSMTSVEPRVAT